MTVSLRTIRTIRKIQSDTAVANRRTYSARASRVLVLTMIMTLSLLSGLLLSPTVSASSSKEPASVTEIQESALTLLTGQTANGQEAAIPERAIKCGTPHFQQLANTAETSGPEMRARIAEAMTRPSQEFFYDSPGGFFRIHYDTSGGNKVLNPDTDNIGSLGVAIPDGVPDYINSVADIFDSVRTIILGDPLQGNLGYPVPPVDSVYGSDLNSRYDVYVSNLGGLFFGATFPEDNAPGFFNGFPFSSYTSYILIDNDFDESSYSSVNNYVARPLDAVRVTAAHEYFHAIHFGIDKFEFEGSPSFPRQYWYEISSVAIEEYIYDEINDYYGYIYSGLGHTPFAEPHRSLQTFPTSTGSVDADFPYAMGVFGMFLTEKWGPELMRSIWLGCGRQGPDFLRAADSALLAHTTGEYNLNDAYREFGQWMFFTGNRAHLAPTGLRFDEAEAYPEIPDDQSQTSYPITISLNVQNPRPEANSNSYIFFKNVFTVTGGCFKPQIFVLPAHLSVGLIPSITIIGLPISDTAVAYVATAPYDNLVLDTTFEIPVGTFDSVMQFYIDSFICHDSIDIDTLSNLADGVVDTIRVFVSDVIPAIQLPNPTDYLDAVMMITQTAIDTGAFLDTAVSRRYQFGYTVQDSSTFSLAVEEQPYTMRAVYPNPVVAADQSSVRFSLDRPLDELPEGAITLRVTIFTENGEKVRDDLSVSGSRPSLSLDWNLQNNSGRAVASGVYIALEQIISSTGDKLTSVTSKILVIR